MSDWKNTQMKKMLKNLKETGRLHFKLLFAPCVIFYLTQKAKKIVSIQKNDFNTFAQGVILAQHESKGMNKLGNQKLSTDLLQVSIFVVFSHTNKQLHMYSV